ncbi:4'-phosphopantetheinyl transferase family protein [Hydrogenophaga sp. XSHU_21]
MTQLQWELGKALGDGVGVACTGIDGDPGQLWPEEREAVQKAIPRRQREFAAGRQAAREAMGRIGFPPQAIPSAIDRSPIWPVGVVGSIAHNNHVCVAILGRRSEVHAIGIDIEDDRPLEADLWPTICTEQELATLGLLPPSDRGHWVTRAFCAKEAYYKWQYPQTGRILDFCDVQLTFNHDHSEFRVGQAPTANVPVLIHLPAGKVRESGGLIVAWLIGARVDRAPQSCFPPASS